MAASVVQVLISRTKNKYNERPIDLLPPSYPGADPESDDEKIRSAIRKAEAEAALGDRGDVVDGKSRSLLWIGRKSLTRQTMIWLIRMMLLRTVIETLALGSFLG